MNTLGIECRICETRAAHRQYVVREMMFGTREVFDYFLCSECGCLQIAIIPTDLSKYYPDNYYSLQRNREPPRHKARSRPRAFLEQLRAGNALFGKGYKLNKFATQFVDIPPEIHSAGSFLKACGVHSWHLTFLDVGCGSRSWWLSDLQALGFRKLVGVDPNIEQDIDDDGIQIHKAQIQDIDGQFDVITLHHSLEHIPDQIDTLQAIKSRLKPRGYCLIRIPLVSSLVWETYGTDWVELDAPRHLYLHSLSSIAILGQKVGLELVRTIWDSDAFEFFGSEQYRRNIPLMAENSFCRDPSQSDFTYKEMAAFSALAAKANQEGRGGRGCFIFRHSDL